MRQRVDPFIPITKKYRPPAEPYGVRSLRKPLEKKRSPLAADVSSQTRRPPVSAITPPHHRPRVISDVVRLPNLNRRRTHLDADRLPTSQEQLSKKRALNVGPITHSDLALLSIVRLSKKRCALLLLILVCCIGLVIQSLTVGEIAIAAYATLALLKRVASRVSFLLALIALIGVVVLVVIEGDDTLSQNFAIYAFLLLIVGTISLGLEARQQTA